MTAYDPPGRPPAGAPVPGAPPPGAPAAYDPAAYDPAYDPAAYDPAVHDRATEAGQGPDSRRTLLLVARGITFFAYAMVTAAVVMLGLGFLLQLFGASPDADFSAWVYRNVARVMEPFRGMFPQRALGERSVLDVSLLFAMVVYGIAALALHALVAWLAQVTANLDRRARNRSGGAGLTR